VAVRAREVGTQIQLQFQTIYPTFTPDVFNKTLQGRSYSMVQAQSNPSPQQPPVAIQLFSKDNVSVYYLQGNNQLVFGIMNTLSLDTPIEEIKQVLIPLNIVPEAISSIVFQCATNVGSSGPEESLSRLLKESMLTKVREVLDSETAVSSIRFGTVIDGGGKDGIQIVIEPLKTSPSTHYNIRVVFRTADMTRFDDFISRFNQDLLGSLVQVVEESA